MSKALQAFNATLKKAGIRNVSGVQISRTRTNVESGVTEQLQLKNVSNTSDMLEAIRTAEEPVFTCKHQEVTKGVKDSTTCRKALSKKESVNVVRIWDGLSPLPESEIFSNPDGVWTGELYIVDGKGVHSMRPVSLLPNPQKTDSEMIDHLVGLGDELLKIDEGEKLLRIVVRDTTGEVRLDESFT